jgi:hypothetical protein
MRLILAVLIQMAVRHARKTSSPLWTWFIENPPARRA